MDLVLGAEEVVAGTGQDCMPETNEVETLADDTEDNLAVDASTSCELLTCYYKRIEHFQMNPSAIKYLTGLLIF